MIIRYNLVLPKLNQEMLEFREFEFTLFTIDIIRSNGEWKTIVANSDYKNNYESYLLEGVITRVDEMEGAIEVNKEYEDGIDIDELYDYFMDFNAYFQEFNRIGRIHNEESICYMIICSILSTRLKEYKMYNFKFGHEDYYRYVYFSNHEINDEQMIPYESIYFKNIKALEVNLI